MGTHETAAARVRVFASPSSWIEGDALRQLETTARLPGMTAAAGMPDLHPGRGIPVGAAFLSEGRFYPHLVGNDIGCGMAMYRTDLAPKKLKADKAERRLGILDEPWDADRAAWLERFGAAPDLHDSALGTVGGGNHFAELQRLEEVFDVDAVAELGLERDRLSLLVHTGSRGYGEAVLREHAARFGGEGLEAGGEEAAAYLARHDRGVAWARANRDAVRLRFMEAVRGEAERVLDVCHNCVSCREAEGRACWLHRKGAAPSDEGPVVIPGSRGTMSWLVQPVGPQEENLWSLAHGAGRKWTRADAKARLETRYRAEDLARTELGGRVVCADRDLLFEEAPQAYKDIDRVVADLVEAGLVRVLASLRPVLTFKTGVRR